MLLPAVAAAQTPPSGLDAGAQQQRARETLEFLDLQKRLREAPAGEVIEDGTRPPQPAPPPDSDARVRIDRIVTNPSEVLSEEEIRSVKSRYEGRELTIADLFEAVEAFNALYQEKKLPTSQAFLPAQRIQDGTVEIRLVEGRLGKVVVENNKHVRSSFFASRMSNRPGEVLRLEKLEDDLFVLNATNSVAATAELKPGDSFGTVDTVIRVQEPPPYQLSLFSDNAGRKETGLYRGGMTFNNNSVFGYNDEFGATVMGSDGSLAALFSYSLPVTSRGTRLGLTYSESKIDVRGGPFEVLGINGESSDGAVRLSHPLHASLVGKLIGFTEVHVKESSTSFSGVEVSGSNVTTLAVGIDWQRFVADGVWLNRHVLTQGVREINGDHRFLRYNGDVVRLIRLRNESALQLRASVQLSDSDLLPSTEQFQLGGAATVRGYTEGLLAGDQGYLVSAELQFPLRNVVPDPSVWPLPSQLRGFFFLDQGGAFPYKAGEGIDHNDFLASTGFGLMMDWSRSVSGRFTVAAPLAKRAGEDDHLNFLFFLQATF